MEQEEERFLNDLAMFHEFSANDEGVKNFLEQQKSLFAVEWEPYDCDDERNATFAAAGDEDGVDIDLDETTRQEVALQDLAEAVPETEPVVSTVSVEPASNTGVESVFAPPVRPSSADGGSLETKKRAQRAARIQEALEEYFNSPTLCKILLRPAGATKKFNLSAVEIDVQRVSPSGGAMFLVEWTIPERSKVQAIESALGNGQSGPAVAATGTDAHIYREYIARAAFDKQDLIHAVSEALRSNVGRIRYELGRKIKTKRVPDLRFKHYEFQQQLQRRLSIGQFVRRWSDQETLREEATGDAIASGYVMGVDGEWDDGEYDDEIDEIFIDQNDIEEEEEGAPEDPKANDAPSS